MLQVDPQDRSRLVDPLFRLGLGFYILASSLVIIMGWGAFVYVRQVQEGLTMTGMQRPVYWGLYMVNFIFFIGISHAGTLISGILRVTQAEWRRPITRIAEAITVVALVVGTIQILFDMGRPERLLWVFRYGRLQSPLLWDVVSVTAYFLGSVIYFYLPLIPDMAILRDNLPARTPAWRHLLYRLLALGWRGNRDQWRRLERIISIMAVIILPIAISVHTIISWILATTVQPGWHSTVFGPYFVVGAIFSGIGALFLAMTTIRWALHLESYITVKQYHYLSLLLITMTAIWFYFTYAEHLTLAAGQQEAEVPVFASKLWGEHAFTFWLMVSLMGAAFWVLVFPHFVPAKWGRAFIFQPRFSLAAAATASVVVLLLLLRPSLPQVQLSGADIGSIAGRHGLALSLGALVIIAGISVLPWLKQHAVSRNVIASACVVAGMWLERWNIIIPTMTHPRLVRWSIYAPTATEWTLTAASFALFIFLFLIIFKLFPAVSIWEVAEGRVIEELNATIPDRLPPSSAPVRRHLSFGRRFSR